MKDTLSTQPSCEWTCCEFEKVSYSWAVLVIYLYCTINVLVPLIFSHDTAFKKIIFFDDIGVWQGGKTSIVYLHFSMIKKSSISQESQEF